MTAKVRMSYLGETGWGRVVGVIVCILLAKDVRCTRFQRLFDFVFCLEIGFVMGHGKNPLPSSPKCDKGSWDGNRKSGIEFGGGGF